MGPWVFIDRAASNPPRPVPLLYFSSFFFQATHLPCAYRLEQQQRDPMIQYDKEERPPLPRQHGKERQDSSREQDWPASSLLFTASRGGANGVRLASKSDINTRRAARAQITPSSSFHRKHGQSRQQSVHHQALPAVLVVLTQSSTQGTLCDSHLQYVPLLKDAFVETAGGVFFCVYASTDQFDVVCNHMRSLSPL